MLESAEQVTEITTELIDLEFLPSTNVERGVRNLEFELQQMHTALLDVTSYQANDIVANSRKNPLDAWRRPQKRYDPATGGRNRNLLRTIISLRRCSRLALQTGIERCGSYASRRKKKVKDILENEIKLATLEASVRWHTTGKRSMSPRDGCSECGGNNFQRETALITSKALARRSSRASHGPRVLAKVRAHVVRDRDGTSKGQSKGSKSANASHKSKSSKAGLSGL